MAAVRPGKSGARQTVYSFKQQKNMGIKKANTESCQDNVLDDLYIKLSRFGGALSGVEKTPLTYMDRERAFVSLLAKKI